MTKCWICGRAMVTGPGHIPYPICQRSRCKHAREDLIDIMATETVRAEYETVAKYERVE